MSARRYIEHGPYGEPPTFTRTIRANSTEDALTKSAMEMGVVGISVLEEHPLGFTRLRLTEDAKRFLDGVGTQESVLAAGFIFQADKFEREANIQDDRLQQINFDPRTRDLIDRGVVDKQIVIRELRDKARKSLGLREKDQLPKPQTLIEEAVRSALEDSNS